MKTEAKRNKPLRRTTSQEFLSQYQLLQNFMDHIPDVIYFKDTKGRLVFVNKAHAKGLGLEPEQVIGKTDFDIFSVRRAQEMTKDDAYVIKTGKSIIDKIERATRADGQDNYVSTTKIPWRGTKGKIIGLMGVTRDVTKRVRFDHLKEEKLKVHRKLEVLEDLNKTKSEFVSLVSHELRTPLAIISQLLSLIFDETAGPITHQQREILVKTKNNLDRLKSIIDKLLDISLVERRKLKLRYSLVNLSDLLKESQDFFTKLAAEKNISLTYQLPKEEVNIFIDVERIIQVVSNLINNAIKFTEENGKITVEVKMLEAKVRIGVADTGIGIAKEDSARVFERFVQGRNIDPSLHKGIGLGLSIVKEIVEKHGGEIWVESEAGVGSKFYFTLPRFHAVNILEKSIKEKIRDLLEQRIPVNLINLFIVNYMEFKKRVDVGSHQLNEDLKEIIDVVFKEFCKAYPGPHPHMTSYVSEGKYSIVFPGVEDQVVSVFCDLLKEKTKDYFLRHKIQDVFIALGVLSYSASTDEVNGGFPLNVKEIYIGSEMRHYKRINYKTDMLIFNSDGNSETAPTVDISQGGICFMYSQPLPTDQEVKIQLKLLKKEKTIRARARVSWLKKMDRLPGEKKEQYKTGLEFISMDNKDKKSLLSELKLYYE